MALSKVDLANQVENQLPQNLVANNLPSRNIIINGDMSIAQRGTSESGINSSGYYTCDRWRTGYSAASVWTQSQSTDVPTGQGFANSTKLDCTTAQVSPTSATNFSFQQKIEGQNLQYLKKGTANATSLTLSFWVKSNKTGTYIVELFDRDNSRHINKSYTIDSANTWEKKTLTFAGDTTGTLDNDNTSGLELIWWLSVGSNFSSGTLQTSWGSTVNVNRAVGQVNLADNTANEWYITGVQLEAGTTASDFEFLPYDVNLRRCYRYYWGWWDKADAAANAATGGLATMYTSTILYSSGFFPVTMRATPSLDQASGTEYYRFIRDGATDYFDDFALSGSGRPNKNGYEMNNTTDVSGTGGQAGFIRCNNVNAYIFFDAEL